MKKIALNGILISLALVLSYIESLFPTGLIIPVPGIKLGLANIVTMFALFYLGFNSAFTITVLRCLLAALLFGGFSSMLYSLSGALLALFGVAMTLVLTPMMAEITYAVDNKAKRHPPGFFGKNAAYLRSQ